MQLLGRKQHIRAVLIDRVMLQHEVSGYTEKDLLTYFGPVFCFDFNVFDSPAAEADSGRLSLPNHPPGADERPPAAFHKHVQRSEFITSLLSGRFHFKHQKVLVRYRGVITTTETFPRLTQIRSRAQHVLLTTLGTYNFCCKDVIPHVLEFLNPDNDGITQEQFKVRRRSPARL